MSKTARPLLGRPRPSTDELNDRDTLWLLSGFLRLLVAYRQSFTVPRGLRDAARLGLPLVFVPREPPPREPPRHEPPPSVHPVSEDAADAPFCCGEEPEAEQPSGFLLHRPGEERVDWRATIARAEQMLQEWAPLDLSSPLSRNIERLHDLVGLSEIERDVLRCFTLLTLHPDARELFGWLLKRKRTHQELLSIWTGWPARDIQGALRGGGSLRALQLLQSEAPGFCTTPEMDKEMALLLAEPTTDVQTLSERFLFPAPPSRLHREDFSHLSAELDLLVRYLRAPDDAGPRGRNVLLFGPPGSGKSELALLAIEQAGRTANLVPDKEVDCDGDESSLAGPQRLNRCVVAQRIVARRPQPGALVFDEIEDAFPHPWERVLSRRGSPGQAKSYTNRLLEENPTPTVWIGNDISQMDEAFLRRFDLVFQLDTPPAEVRARILRARLGKLRVESAWLGRVAQDERIMPADLERATRVARLVGAAEVGDAQCVMDRCLQGHLSLTGRGELRTVSRPPLVPFELGYLNASLDIERMVQGLRAARQGSVCLSGPPGTGKSALARYVAEALGRPLEVARASDLFDKYVGQTEQRIAQLFRRAAARQAVLFLDEADSFFRSRQRANQSWEVTQVNEMLVQLEAFEGVFLCATNLSDELDPASLRRFDLKVRLEPLSEEQRRSLFRATVEHCCHRPPGQRVGGLDDEASWLEWDDPVYQVGSLHFEQNLEELLDGLRPLEGLTIGDYFAATRRLQLMDELSADALLCALSEEHAAKPGRTRRMGFG